MTQEKAVREIIEILNRFPIEEKVEILNLVVNKSIFTLRLLLHKKLVEETNCSEVAYQTNAILEISGK